MTEHATAQKIPLIFFRSGKGTEPVREWLKELPEAERQAVGRDLLRAQWRWPVSMPLCRPMGNGLWEIRTGLPTKRAAHDAVPVPRTLQRRTRIWRWRASARRS